MSRGVEIIESVLKEFGYQAEPEKPKFNGNAEGDTPYAELNALALANLMLWVPHVGLHNCVRQRGRFPSYIAVAHWRPSSTGRPLEQRAQNLKICGSGIKDFGDGRTYSPLDLTMAAKGIELKEAFDWLDEKLGSSTGGPEIDVEAIGAMQAPAQDRPDTQRAPQPP